MGFLELCFMAFFMLVETTLMTRRYGDAFKEDLG